MASVGSAQIFDILREMHSDTFRNAAPMPMKSEEQTEWQGLGFQISGVRLVSPLGEIDEVMKLPRYTTLPGVQPWVLGIANVRGRLIPIVDMHKYLDITTALPRKEWRVLVVEDGDLVVGLLVEQSLGMQHFLEESFEESTPPEDMTGMRRNLRGAYRYGGRKYYVVSLASFIRDERLFEVAQLSK